METSGDRGLKLLSAAASKKNKIAPWAVGVFTFVGIITVVVICTHNLLVIYLWYSRKGKSQSGKPVDAEAAKNPGGKPLAKSGAPATTAPNKTETKPGKTADPKTSKTADPKTSKIADPKTEKKTVTKTVQKAPGGGVARTYIHIFVPVGERWQLRQHLLSEPLPTVWRHFDPNKPNSILYPRNKKGKGPDAAPSVKLSEFGNVDAKSALKENQKHLTLEEEKQIVKKEKPPANYAEFLSRAEEQYANLKSDAKEDMRPSVLLLHYVENQETKQKAKKKGEVVKEKTESAAEESALKKKTELVKPKTKTKVVEDKTESAVDQSVLNKEKKHTKTKTKVVEEKSPEEQSMTDQEPEPVKPQKKTKVPAESQESAAEKSFESKETERLKTKVKKPGKASKGKIKPDKKPSKAGKKTKGKKNTADNTQSSASDDN